jgi:hypothetical protein
MTGDDMNTEDDLRAGLRGEGIDMAEHDRFLIGLADGALAQARKQTRARRLGVVGVAAVAVAGISVSVLAMNGSPRADRNPIAPVAPSTHETPTPQPAITSTSAPGSLPAPPLQGPLALAEFGTACAPKSSSDPGTGGTYLWNAAVQKYVATKLAGLYYPSPNGTEVVVTTPAPSGEQWAVGSVADAIAGTHLTFHPLPGDVVDMSWTPDGKEVMVKISTGTDFGKYVVNNPDVKFLDPASGTVHSVPFPAPVEDAVKGRSKEGWLLEGWTGDEDSLVYVLASPQGSEFEWIDEQGHVVGTAQVQGSYKTNEALPLTVTPSPSGRYLMVRRSPSLDVFDLRNHGAPVLDPAVTTTPFVHLWTADDQIVASVLRTDQVIEFQVLSADGRSVLQDHRFTVPSYLGDKCPETPVRPVDLGFVPGFEGAFILYPGGA